MSVWSYLTVKWNKMQSFNVRVKTCNYSFEKKCLAVGSEVGPDAFVDMQ